MREICVPVALAVYWCISSPMVHKSIHLSTNFSVTLSYLFMTYLFMPYLFIYIFILSQTFRVVSNIHK
jgi:hypothetical protein